MDLYTYTWKPFRLDCKGSSFGGLNPQRGTTETPYGKLRLRVAGRVKFTEPVAFRQILGEMVSGDLSHSWSHTWMSQEDSNG